MSNANIYTIGWICALHTEYVAARAFLDEKHEQLDSVPVNNSGVYTLGRIGKHNVVISVLPDGEYGIGSAAAVATNLLNSFPNVRIGLMVGIGGGAPSSKNDIRLGDVVVSAPRNGKGGVFQYDFGKTMQDQEFSITGFLNQPPRVLLTAIADLRARHEEEGHQIDEAINAALEKMPKLRRKYKRPDPGTDQLYKSEVVHPLNDESSCMVLCGADSSNLVSRPERDDDENLAIHYGLVASANQVMKDALSRDKLAVKKNVLCFEMEAAGLMNHFPCIVIRGICDYSDSHKSKVWQGYAAMIAAAYAKELLRGIVPNQLEAERRIIDIISNIEEEVKRISAGVGRLVSGQGNREHADVLDWLTPVNYGLQHSDYVMRRQPGTGQWFLETDEYQVWLEESGTLYCPGIPGAGKTILTSIVIDDLYERFGNNSDVGIAYIYCNFRRQDEQIPEIMMACLLKQLAQRQPSVPESISDLYKHHKARSTRPSYHELFRALQVVAALYTRLFIVVDALDECQHSNGCRSKFLAGILDLQHNGITHLFATSRPILSIDETFTGSTLVEIRASDADIERYLDGHLPHIPGIVGRSPGMHERIKQAIISAVQGMFLLAQLHLNSLKDLVIPKSVQTAIRQLPRGSEAYNHVYHETMQRIASQATEPKLVAMRVLGWITCAKRPLTTRELQHALAVQVNEPELDTDNISQIQDMVSICAGLVTVEDESKIIRLVHYTTQEYLKQTQGQWFPDIEIEITQTCITYLSFGVFEVGICKTKEQYYELNNLYPLHAYSSQYWSRHAPVSPTSIVYHQALRFLEFIPKVELSAHALLSRTEHDSNVPYWSEYRPMFAKGMTGLHVASYLGVKTVIEFLLNSTQIDQKTHYGRTSLQWASMQGHEAVVQLLLSHGANIKADGDGSLTSLQLASMNGYEVVVKLLLSHGANIEAESNKGKTSLQWASMQGHEAVVQLLLSHGANTEADGDRSATSLQLASIWGHKAVVKLLLSHGANIEAEGDSGMTSLQWASRQGNEAVVQLLLNTGTNIEAEGNNSKTSLQWASMQGHEAVVQLLLSHGANIEAGDDRGRTPLQWASIWGHEAVVRLLLDKGANAQSRDESRGMTALCWAVNNSHLACVRILLACSNPDPNPCDNLKRNPLAHAAQFGNDEIILQLVSTGKMDIDAKDFYLSTPLSIAVRHGHRNAVKILLDTGRVDLNSEDWSGRTPLWFARRNGNSDVLDLLLNKAEENGISLKENRKPDRSHQADSELKLRSVPGGRICDVCTLGILVDSTYYHCGICYADDFDMCLDCYELGAHCLEAEHQLESRIDGKNKARKNRKRRLMTTRDSDD